MKKMLASLLCLLVVVTLSVTIVHAHSGSEEPENNYVVFQPATDDQRPPPDIGLFPPKPIR